MRIVFDVSVPAYHSMGVFGSDLDKVPGKHGLPASDGAKAHQPSLGMTVGDSDVERLAGDVIDAGGGNDPVRGAARKGLHMVAERGSMVVDEPIRGGGDGVRYRLGTDDMGSLLLEPGRVEAMVDVGVAEDHMGDGAQSPIREIFLDDVIFPVIGAGIHQDHPVGRLNGVDVVLGRIGVSADGIKVFCELHGYYLQ